MLMEIVVVNQTDYIVKIVNKYLISDIRMDFMTMTIVKRCGYEKTATIDYCKHTTDTV